MDQSSINQKLFDELHSRPFPKVSTPCSASYFVVLSSESHDAEIAPIATLADQYGVPCPKPKANCYYQKMGDFEFRWERHTEFTSYIVISSSVSDHPFERTALSLIPLDWLENLSGELVGGEHLEIRMPSQAGSQMNPLFSFFDGQNLIGSSVLKESATLYTSLTAGSDGFCRVLVESGTLNISDCGRLVRSIMELAAYRNLTLMAFPVARQLITVVSSMESRLAILVSRLAKERQGSQEKILLDELFDFAVELEQLITDNNFRFAATEAYYLLTEDRLKELEEEKIAGLNTLSEVHYRKLRPGFSTCQSIRRRLGDLSVRVDRATSLIRTRVDIGLKSDNQMLLRAINNRARHKLRLQQAVEGFSIIAISYYSLQLFNYLLKGLKTEISLPNSDLILAVVCPVVLFLSWVAIRRIRGKYT